MKKGIFFLVLLSLITQSTYAATLTAIDFRQTGEISQLELVFNQEDVLVEKFPNIDGKQIFLDFKNVKATNKVLRGFDTSEFSGSMVFVKAYPRNDKKDLRVAVQLRENTRSVIERKGNKVILNVENRFGVFSQNEVEDNQTFEEQINKDDVTQIHVPKSDSLEDILHNLTLSGRKKYVGKKITLNVTDIGIKDILKMIADSSGFNIILTEDVQKLPPLTLKLTNVPWDQILDTVLGLSKLVAEKNGIILLVTTLKSATDEKKRKAEAQIALANKEALVTRVFSISYAKLKDLSEIIGAYTTPERGSIALDQRTNSVIVKDTVAVIERVRKIIEVLDTQTPQVLIESKIVEVSEVYAKEIGLKNGISWGYDPIGTKLTGSTEVGSSVVSGFDGGPGFSFSTAPSSDSTLFGLAINRFGRVANLAFNLQLMESESKGKIIATPKVITQNKEKAVIKTTDTTSYAVVTGTGDDQTQNYEETEASLQLEVVPQVTNDGSILMSVDLQKTQFGNRPAGLALGPPEKASRAVKTTVLVENGSTIVLGGIYSFQKTESHSGIPFLKNLPLIGWLFRTPHNPQVKKNEMIIFLTPRIINQEEAGLIATEAETI